jgi:hypothetical protein
VTETSKKVVEAANAWFEARHQRIEEQAEAILVKAKGYEGGDEVFVMGGPRKLVTRVEYQRMAEERVTLPRKRVRVAKIQVLGEDDSMYGDVYAHLLDAKRDAHPDALSDFDFPEPLAKASAEKVVDGVATEEDYSRPAAFLREEGGEG